MRHQEIENQIRHLRTELVKATERWTTAMEQAKDSIHDMIDYLKDINKKIDDEHRLTNKNK